MKKVFCVISHTHWDREWYMPVDIFKLRLIDLIDRLIKIIERYPSFIFHLDAQTIVLEDYLEVRPEKKELLGQYISSGNIVVGPWYLQNDFYLTSGEATIRNLLEGRKIAGSFGKCGTVGYAPDQFGNISQLPQILSNFGVNNFVFGRGFNQYAKNEAGDVYRVPTPSEFIWKGADGTQVLAICMNYWYNNAQRFSADEEKAIKLVKRIEASFEGVVATPYLLLMNGVDHLEPQGDLLPILEQLNEKLEQEKYIRQYDLGQYVQAVQSYISENNVSLQVHQGEMRFGHDFDLLKGTLSSRHYLKVANVKMQNMLENKLEPLYAMLEHWGCRGIYSIDHFRYMWKKLMQNHPHDSICGCSRDEVHKHMEDNFERLNEFAGNLLKRGLMEALYHTENVTEQGQDYSLIAVNTLGYLQDGVLEVEAVIPKTDGLECFSVYQPDGREVPFVIRSKETREVDVFSPVNLPGRVMADCYRLYLYVQNVAPFSVKRLVIKKSQQVQDVFVSKVDDVPVIENERVRLTVSDNGQISFTDLQTGRTVKNCLYIEDTADRGDSYVYFKAGDEPVLSSRFTPVITVLEKNEYCGRCKIEWEMALPAYYDFEHLCRSQNTEITTVSVTLSVSKGKNFIEAEYEVDNRCKDHRIRLVVATDVLGGACFADIPYDIIKRQEGQHYFETMSKVFPNTSFALLEDNCKGFAVFTEGAHEFEHLHGNALAFTILRSTGIISRCANLEEGGGDVWKCPDNQCIRKLSGRLGMMLYCSSYEVAEVPKYATVLRNPLLAYFAPEDRRKLSGGRPAVQDSDLQEFFYLPDEYPNGKIPDSQSAVRILGKNVAVSAFKKSEDGRSLILRLYNYGTADEQVCVNMSGFLFQTDMAEEKLSFLGRNKVDLLISAKQIYTLRID